MRWGRHECGDEGIIIKHYSIILHRAIWGFFLQWGCPTTTNHWSLGLLPLYILNLRRISISKNANLLIKLAFHPTPPLEKNPKLFLAASPLSGYSRSCCCLKTTTIAWIPPWTGALSSAPNSTPARKPPRMQTTWSRGWTTALFCSAASSGARWGGLSFRTALPWSCWPWWIWSWENWTCF